MCYKEKAAWGGDMAGGMLALVIRDGLPPLISILPIQVWWG